MTPIFDSLISRWRKYKIILVTCIALNVFSVCAAAVLGFYFFIYKNDLVKTQQASIEKIRKIESTLSHLSTLQEQWPKESSSQKTTSIPISQLDLWLKIQNELQTLNLSEDSTLSRLKNLPDPQAWVPLQNQLTISKNLELQSLEKNLGEFRNNIFFLTLIGSITLIFGILLPLAIIHLMTRLLNRLRKEMQKTVIEIMRTWAENKAQFGSSSFKNFDFWLQSVLILSSAAAQWSSHPLALLAGELSHLIRLELQKQQKSAS